VHEWQHVQRMNNSMLVVSAYMSKQKQQQTAKTHAHGLLFCSCCMSIRQAKAAYRELKALGEASKHQQPVPNPHDP